jgi:hypothetical protein
MSNGQWIGDRAVEAVMALAGEKAAMQQQMQGIADLLNQVGIPSMQEGPAGTGRPLSLIERVQILINAKVQGKLPEHPGDAPKNPAEA